MILYQIWCKRTYVSGGFCEGEDEPTQLIFTTLEKALRYIIFQKS